MHLIRSVVCACVVLVVAVSPVSAGLEDGRGSEVVPGARQVHVRNATGGFSVHTSIPGGSAFASHGGGQAAECNGVVAGDDPDTIGIIEEVHSVRTRVWIFIEGVREYAQIPDYLEIADLTGRPSLAQTLRTFSVYCADTVRADNFRGFVQVSGTDPLLDPRPRLTNLYNSLQVETVAVYENAVVDRWGGLVVRSPAWLAINGSAWRAQRSNVEYWRGWELSLIAVPVGLEFLVEFAPDPERPSPAFSGVIACVQPGDSRTASPAVEFPQRPSDLGDFAEPGSSRPCVWTPPGPGVVTITARQRFAMTFWASGAVEAQPDYVWSSPPTTFRVGELAVVNVNGEESR